MKISIVVCGWHFDNPDLYRKLIDEAKHTENPEFSYFIASHKKPDDIDDSFLDMLNKSGWKILYFENEGWDWGAYQQFMVRQKETGALSDYYLFVHDDIKIKQNGFIDKFIEKVDSGCCVVGNGFHPAKKIELQKMYPEDVLWAEVNGHTINIKECFTVRGSCFFAIKDAAENILAEMPIKKAGAITFANSSLRVFAGLVTEKFGENAIGFIGDKLLSSKYISEGFRGADSMPLKTKVISKVYPYINKTVLKRILGFKKVMPVKRGFGLKLNLDCGYKPLEGYFNIDAVHPNAEMNADILELEFDENTIAEVLMVHVIEHIDRFAVEPFIKKIYGWLKTNGQLVLEFPNVEKDDIHRWGWTKSNISPILKNAGFRKIYVERSEHHVAKRDTRIVAVK